MVSLNMRCSESAVKLSLETAGELVSKTLVFETMCIKVWLVTSYQLYTFFEMTTLTVRLGLQMIRRSMKRPPAAPSPPTKPERPFNRHFRAGYAAVRVIPAVPESTTLRTLTCCNSARINLF